MSNWIVGRQAGQLAPVVQEDDRVPLRAGARRRGGVMSMRAGVVSMVAAVASLVALAGTASASITREPEPYSPLTGAGSGVGFEAYSPSAVAVDEATGNVFATDGGYPAGEGLVILGGEGGAPAGLASPFVVPGTTTYFSGNTSAFVAYDNSASSPSKGAVYAYDQAGKAIRKYVRDATTEQYAEVASGEISLPGCGRGSGGGIDGDGDIYFTCSEESALYEFSPTGALLHEYSLAGTPLQYGQIAFDSAGDLFMQTQAGGVYKLPKGPTGEIEPARYEEVAASAKGVAYDSEANEVLVAEQGRVEEFNATTLAKVGEFGNETLTRENNGQIFSSRPERVAVDQQTGLVYVVDTGNGDVAVFGHDVVVPTVATYAASNITGTKAMLNGGVSPEGIEVSECFFEYGETTKYSHVVSCESLPPTDSESHPVSASISGLATNGATYHYRLVVENKNGFGRGADKTLATAGTVVTEAASAIAPNAVTLNGYVRPEGLQYGECQFEYKLPTETTYTQAPCAPAASAIEPDFSEHEVSAQLEGLKANTTYEFRLEAANSDGVKYGEVLRFTTTGPPQISELRASFADETSVTLEAEVNPSGFGTYYHFEWGTGTGYGHVVPVDFAPFIGSGMSPVRVTAKLTGLSAQTVYHYRVVATNNLDGTSTTESPDQTFETLDFCGLPDGRCLEMVSPKQLGPNGAPLRPTFGAAEIKFQASEAPGDLAYAIENGLEGATNAYEVLYESTRSAAGWQASQLSPPITARNEQSGLQSNAAEFLALSPDLSCGVVGSSQPLSGDPAERVVEEVGGVNLYRRGPDGSYTLITATPPKPLEAQTGLPKAQFRLIGMSPDCSHVAFTSKYRYPDVPSGGGETPYEWDEEHGLRNAGWVPGQAGEEVVEAEGDGASEDGSRVFFTAKRIVPGNPADSAEVGKEGVFAREDGSATRDLSASETSIPDAGATYLGATPDGSRVYFTANAGLTDESHTEGTDLYEYDLEKKPDEHPLTDLTVSSRPGGADVTGLVGVSDDGTIVYFYAEDELTPGSGDAAAIYEASGGGLRLVAHAAPGDNDTHEPTTRVSGSGRYLLFESTAEVTGYRSAGTKEIYLYDSDPATGSDPIVCVSCRQDGAPAAEGKGVFLTKGWAQSDPLYAPGTLTVRNGEPEVFFGSSDRLADSATEGISSLYEWAHGQVFYIASEAANLSAVEFMGASTNGTDVYFWTPAPLNWENPEGRYAAWDARVGGGFAKPAAPPPGCVPTSEGSCQGAGSSAPALGAPASVTFSGPGNLVPQPEERHAKTHQKRAKKHKHNKKARHGSHRDKGRHGGHQAKGRNGRHRSKRHGARKARRHVGRSTARHANGKGRTGK